MSLMKKVKITVGILLTVAVLIYGIFWFVVADQINKQIDTVWVSMGAGGAKTDASQPEVYGFPFPPTVTFNGTITEENGTIWTFPELTYRGFPLSGFSMTLNAPKGFSIQGPLFPQPVNVDEGYIYLTLPHNLPGNMDVQNLKVWQQAGGQIPIDALLLRSGELLIQGNGHLTLDEQLQLAGQVDAKIVGMDALLQELTTRGVLKGGSAVMAQNFLMALSQKDPATGQSYFIAQIKIQKRGVFFGPLRIGYMPEIVWEAGEKLPN